MVAKSTRWFSRTSTRGFTIVELLTVLSIIGLLVALLLPAIQSARGSARRAVCSSNLRSIGLALANYESMHGVIPGGSNGYGYSLHVMLLPHLEQQPLYGMINFSVAADMIYQDSPNRTAFLNKVSVFHCPTNRLIINYNNTAYAGNRGVGERITPDSGVFLSASKSYRSKDIADGRSRTIALSEWVPGPVSITERDAKGSVFLTPSKLNGEENLLPFLQECKELNPWVASLNQNDKGINWMLGGYRHTLYNHMMTVNQSSCVSEGRAMEGAYSASSRHHNGANSLFMDGHSRFMTNDIQIEVWRALSTPAGNETLTDNW